MGLKKYIVFSIILLLIIGAYVFTLEPGDYRIEIMGNGIVLPVVVWVMAPFALLLVVSIFHLIYYGAQSYLRNRAIIKDYNNLLLQIQEKILKKEEAARVFKTEEFKEISHVLSQLDLELKSNNFISKCKTLNEAANSVIDVKNGKYINLKPFKLSDDNELSKENFTNRVKEDEAFCLDVFKRPSNYPSEVVKVAYFIVLKDKSMTTIKKALPQIVLDKDMLKALLERDSKEVEFRLSKDELIKYLKTSNFDSSEFLDVAKLYKVNLNPDELIEIFENVSSENEAAMNAYIYILFEYEMKDKVRDILTNASEEDYLPYKALLELKDMGKQCTLESISYK